jgi:DNA-directed RNA polymerase subunit M/transcription elongation factor TFIIS
MKFCVKCNNMYYISINPVKTDQLSYYCRNCGNTETQIEEGCCILNTELRRGDHHFEHIVNKYTKLDPTLPRIHNIPCPNLDCSSNIITSSSPRTPREVLYMRYDDNNLKYLYMCCICDRVWTKK